MGAQAALASRAAQAAGHKQDDAFVPPITVNSQAAARLLAIHSDAITPATAAYLSFGWRIDRPVPRSSRSSRR
jgi:hypothetical protein